MIFGSVNGENALQEALTGFIKKRKQEDFGAPSTKKAEEIQLAKQRAFKDGVAVVLSGMVNDRRRELYRQLPSGDRPWLVPLVHDGDVFMWLREYENAWEMGEYKDLSDEDMWAAVEKSFDENLVREERFAKVYEEDRRKCVLAGMLDPNPEDADWLEEEVNQYKSITAPAEAALEKLREKLVN